MTFSAWTVGEMPDGERRQRELDTASAQSMPGDDAEEWRYSPIGDLDLDRFEPRTRPPVEVSVAQDLVPDAAAVVVVIDGWVTEVQLDPGWAAKGLQVGPASDTADRTLKVADPSRIDQLHLALAPDALRVTVPGGVSVDRPVVISSHHTGAGIASFPHVVVEVGDNAELAVIEQQTSEPGDGFAAPLVEVHVGPSARARYTTIQELSPQTWQLARQVSSVGDQANLVTATAAFGGAYARLRSDSELVGRGATGEMLAVYYGDQDQILDFRTFQHHRGRDTSSDLLFKGAGDDRSGSIYTGLIQIHPEGAGSNAHQTNRNVKLSDDAWAWSVPNLEIENNDVRCSHASTVSPVDVDQRFYLHARGVPPTVADRLIVAGFFDEVIERFPEAGVRAHVRGLVADKLDRRSQ